MNNELNVKTIFSAETVATSATASCTAIDLSDYYPEGNYSLQVTFTATTGTTAGKITYKLSNDDSTYVTPTSATSIVLSLSATGGPSSGGYDLYSFSPEPAKYMKILVENLNATEGLGVTAHLFVK